ncbi:MAG TPA: hypothetical protein VH186_22795 [Chloroflexia bacterium]|nr:hypothetical protein [Chloroflexia bacterium]
MTGDSSAHSNLKETAESSAIAPGDQQVALEEKPGAEIKPARGALLKFRPAWLPHLLVLALYTGLTFFYLAPMLPRFFQEVPFGGDSWIFYWDLWWVKKALVELHTNPFYTTFINYPGGASLNFHTLAFLDGLIATPLQVLGVSLAGSFNLLVFFGFIFSAYGAFLLADYLVHNKPAAFVAGLVFGFSPFHTAHLNGQLNFVTIQWIPFYVLFMLKAVEGLDTASWRIGKKEWKNLGLAALFLALNALTEWTLAAFLFILTGLYLLYRLWLGRKQLKTTLLGPVWRLGVVFLLFAAITSPVLIPMVNEARTNKNVKFTPEESIVYSADLLSFITPYELHPIMGSWAAPLAEKYSGMSNPAERTVYLGITVLVLAILGWLLCRKYASRALATAGFWLISGVFFVLLAMGPLLHVSARPQFTVFKVNIMLPYAVMYYLPFFSIMRTPARFVLMAMLALAMLSAFGIKGISDKAGLFSKNNNKRLSGGVSFGLAIVASALIIFEFAPYVTTAFPFVPPIYDVIRNDPNPGHVVLELPLKPTAHYYIAQPSYDKPMIGGYLARQIDNPLVNEIPALKTLALDSGVLAGSEAQLKSAGIKYVMVNWWMLNDQEKAQMNAALQQIFNRQPDAVSMEPDGKGIRLTLFILK